MKVWKRRISAYMTVEASLIMPIVLFFYLFFIELCLFMYDRCLLEQDMAVLSVKLAGNHKEETKILWKDCLADWEKEAYLWMKPQEPELKESGWKLTITGKAENKLWGKLKAQYEIRKLSPVKWLRGRQRFGKEKDS